MRLKLVKIEETDFLSDKAKAECGRYWTIYLYDADEGTYCCELQPSYWLEAVFFETEKWVTECLNDDLQQCLYESSHYRHCWDAKRLPTQTVTTEFDNFEEAREHFQSNCSFGADREAA
jgi:hypothetical protein